MMRRRILALALLAATLPGAPPGAAQALVTEVFTIGYRPVDEMIGILRPLVPPPGSVSGAYGKIVVRTTPENMRDVREILATLDRAPANLLVSVRHSMNEEVRRDLYEAFGQVGGDDAAVSTGRRAEGGGGLVIRHEDAGVRVDRSRSTVEDAGTQRVRVLEGKEAFIRTGQSVPVTEERVVTQGGVTTIQRSTAYRNVDSGFYVRARLADDDRVNVEIFPRRNRLAGDSGAVDVREASTVVSSRLGRWMEIGGVDSRAARSTREIGARSGEQRTGGSVTYLKVERLDR